ncbi:ion channel [Thalassotalea euphylliae]|uniref:ion channel n=1 Tax=Thalassotalea euphylliae TaxID=1655234 RepID=UPI0036345F2A
MSKNNSLCQYTDESGCQCREPANDTGFCYWHDKTADKSGDNVKDDFETYVKSGGLLRGVILKRANLANIDLVNHRKKNGYDFTHADFYRADLQNAHMFNINLTNASLMKADLRCANLNCATLQDTNLLGARWADSKIENIKIGKRLRQEQQARQAVKARKNEEAIDLFEQAEEIYRDLRKHAEHEGIFMLAGRFIQKELTMRRMQLPKYSIKRISSKVVDLFCGYGEAPVRIVGISICMIIVCAFLYLFTGLNYQGEIHSFNPDATLAENAKLFLGCLYYSVVTFTTLGYGDFAPIGFSRAIAAMEAFTGSFTIALFVVVFVKKMTR